MKRFISLIIIYVTLFQAFLSTAIFAQESEERSVCPVALLAFQDRSKEVAGQGKIVADILFANIATDPAIVLVDREDLETVLKEQELNLSGLVNPAQAVQVGHLLGAKIIVTGSVVRTENSTYLVAKIIGTETTRVLGVSEKGGSEDAIDKLAENLAGKITKTILKNSSSLIAKTQTRENRIEAIKEKIKDKPRPTLWIDVPEEHLNRRTVDPAVETELTFFAGESGFTILDKTGGEKSKAEVLILGEAFSERGMPIGNLISVKARVELKAVDPGSGKVLAAERQTIVTVDLVEAIAAKTALQQAGAALAERLLPKLVK